MKTWLVRTALRLVPPDWRATVSEDVQDAAESENRGAAWSAWQAGRAGLRLRAALAMDACRFDLQTSYRSLRNGGWFTCGAVLTFALGIGVNVAVFSAVDRVLFRELPYERPDELIVMREVGSNGQPFGTVPGIVAAEVRRQHRGILDLSVAGFSTAFSLSREPDEEAPLRLTSATHNTLEVFGVGVLRGRDFTDDDARQKARLALISFDAWKNRFGRTDDVIGRRIWSGADAVEIIGVLPERFIPASNFLDPRSDGFVLDTGSDSYGAATPSARFAPPYLRLKPGVSLQAAQAELDVVVESVRRVWPAPANRPPTRIELAPLRSILFGRYTSYLWLITAAASLVLAAACANLGSLMLVRNRSREHLAATQVALGASPWRLMRVGLIESALLSSAGAAVSLLVIGWSDTALRTVLPPVFSRYAASVVDPRVLIFALLTALACTAVAGAYPSWRIARVDVLAVLQRGNASTRLGRLRGSRSLLVVEAALSVMLVAGATLAVRSFVTLSTIDVGFQPDDLQSVYVTVPFSADPVARFQQAQQVGDVLASVPGVLVAATADISPLSGSVGMVALGPGLNGTSRWQVTDGFFAAMGMRVVAGRTMTAAEVASSAPVGVLSESGLRVVWPDVRPYEAVGRTLRFEGEADRQVVGVVSDVRAGYATPSIPSLYVPLTANGFRRADFVIRMAPGAVPVLSDIRSRLVAGGVNPSSITLSNVKDDLRTGVRDQRFRAVLFSAFGITALLLAAVGLYAVGSYEVAQRRREVGLRLAIGGSPLGVQWLIVSQALLPVAVGIGAGIVGSYWAATFVQAFLFQVDARDPATLGFVILVLLVASAVAAWLPAHRAARLDPASILRAQ
jgi:predicted permease